MMTFNDFSITLTMIYCYRIIEISHISVACFVFYQTLIIDLIIVTISISPFEYLINSLHSTLMSWVWRQMAVLIMAECHKLWAWLVHIG